MIRFIRFLPDLLMFFLPFVIYFGWVKFVRRQMQLTGGTWQDAPIAWLVAAGAVLFTISLTATIILSEIGDDPSKTYVPPHYEDGHIVPSHVQ
jgi:hypothetical protein